MTKEDMQNEDKVRN